MERFSEDAVVLSTVDYGEADRLVTLLTAGRGKLTAFAVGARKSRRRFSGALEPFTHLTAHLVERQSELLRLNGVDVQDSFPRLRTELVLIARAHFCVELCRDLLRDREPHERLFSMLVSYLGLLARGEAGPTSLLAFELGALAQAGLAPRFAPCALCAGPTGMTPRFDAEHGGVVCAGCAARASDGEPLTPELVESLRQLQAGSRVPLPEPTRRKARALLQAFIGYHLGHRLKSAAFMDDLGFD